MIRLAEMNQDGAICTTCKDPIYRGDRAYEKSDGSFAHYDCLMLD